MNNKPSLAESEFNEAFDQMVASGFERDEARSREISLREMQNPELSPIQPVLAAIAAEVAERTRLTPTTTSGSLGAEDVAA